MLTSNAEFWITVRAATSELAGLRTHVRDRAIELGADDALVDEFLLVVSELATNVLMHTTSDHVEVLVDRAAESWVLEVAGADGLDDVNPVSAPGPGQIGGRGLFIVNAVMDEVALVDGASGRFVRCIKFVA
jgi:anti-sigma regulatory factor (Ser/Thr protein kinase)